MKSNKMTFKLKSDAILKKGVKKTSNEDFKI